jgi:hypothetical protein
MHETSRLMRTSITEKQAFGFSMCTSIWGPNNTGFGDGKANKDSEKRTVAILTNKKKAWQWPMRK